jgi:glycosyltransferase involved in cell wall biosynthesis
LVSIIMVTLNSASTLRRALDSVASQTMRNRELIVVDGGSTDGTMEQIRGPESGVTRFISERDRGIYDAMNKGVALASGEWIYFLGSDDALFDAATLEQLRPLLLRRDLDVIYGDVLLDDGTRYDGAFRWGKLYDRNVCHQSIFYRRRVFDRLGGFCLDYPFLADWALNIQVFGDSSFRKKHTNQVIAHYSTKGSSFTRPDHAFLRDRPRLYRTAFGRLRFFEATTVRYRVKRIAAWAKRHLDPS